MAKNLRGKTFTDFAVSKPSAKVFLSFLHYLPELISERLKSTKANSEFCLQLQSFPPQKFCCICMAAYTYVATMQLMANVGYIHHTPN